MKTILVTGGAGYIGTHTAVELVNAGYNVIIIDDFSNSNPKILSNLFKITGSSVKVYARDIREPFNDILATHSVDGVIHFAAHKSVPESVSQPQKYYDNNINTLLSVIDHCQHFNINNLIFSSSCSIYGNVDGAVDENTDLNPQSPYAYTKMMGERIISDYCNSNSNMKAISLRYFNPVGAHSSGLIGESSNEEPSNLFPRMCQYAKGTLSSFSVYGTDYNTRDGSCIRDYVHVSDIANAHVLAMSSILSTSSGLYDVYNLGSENGISVLEAIQAFKKVTGINLEYGISSRRPGDIASICSNSSKAKHQLGWTIRYGIDEMIDTAWKWENSNNI